MVQIIEPISRNVLDIEPSVEIYQHDKAYQKLTQSDEIYYLKKLCTKTWIHVTKCLKNLADLKK